MFMGNQTKELHDFFTPRDIAMTLLAPVFEAHPGDKPMAILEPAVGHGYLIWPLLESDLPFEITVNDIVPEYLEFVLDKARSEGYQVDGNMIRNYK